MSLDLKEYLEEDVKIITIDNEEFEGFVTDYIFAEDNEPEEEAIIIETPEGKSIEFKISEIKEIEESS